MNTLERRLLKMETQQKTDPMTAAELDRCLDERLAKEGMTRDQAIAKHGSMAAYAYAAMCATVADTCADSDDGTTAAERYMAMLKD